MNIKQLQQWYGQLIAGDQHKEWHETYKKTFELVSQYRQRLQTGIHLDIIQDAAFLSHLLKNDENGVASKGQSIIKQSVYDQMILDQGFINTVEQLILDPSLEKYNEFTQVGEKRLRTLGSTRRPLLFNRACASCTLDVSPVVHQRKLDCLMRYLKKENIFEIPDEIMSSNWYEKNIYLVDQVKIAFKDELEAKSTDEYLLNIFLWQIYAEIISDKKTMTLKTDQHDKNALQKDQAHDAGPLNRILFGAAGTGKTYHSINHAVEIIDGKPENPDPSYDDIDREDLKDRFDEYVAQGRIRFVTFHQSFSYEDFIEGIRAETDKNTQQLSYPVRDGVFKEICKQAMVGSLQGQCFGKHMISKDYSDYYEVVKPNGNLLMISKELSGFLIDQIKNNKISVSDIKNGNVIEKLGDHPILEPQMINGYSGLLAQLVALIIEQEQSVDAKEDPYVLIIDEINRGNISRIFGELITLIEDSKRHGAKEALSVMLPYSKQPFSVPKNVYIIGTMNSSDRSLTGLDMALRRRFSFVEMQPNPELLRAIQLTDADVTINIADLLTVMNQRIEVLLDCDHCIGHANFMSLSNESNLSDLADIFKQKIIPLLQEYFFDDWSKINLVLFDNGMLEKKPVDQGLFPSKMADEYISNDARSLWRMNEHAFTQIETYRKILGHLDSQFKTTQPEPYHEATAMNQHVGTLV